MKKEITGVKISVDEAYMMNVPLAWVWRGDDSKFYPVKSPARFIRVSQLMRALLRKIRVS